MNNRNSAAHCPKLELLAPEMSICIAMQIASRAIFRIFDDQLRHLGVNNWQMAILLALSEGSSPTINELADVTGTDRTTMSRNLSLLNRRGLIGVRSDEGDQRLRRVGLTEAGYAVVNAAQPVWHIANANIQAKLRFEELAILQRALARLTRI